MAAVVAIIAMLMSNHSEPIDHSCMSIFSCLLPQIQPVLQCRIEHYSLAWSVMESTLKKGRDAQPRQ